MRRSLAAAVTFLVAATAAAPVAADTVRLRNGRAYEGVIADEVAGGVRIQLAFGHLVLPHEQVLAVEKSPSALAEYLRRKAALAADGTAGEWLALARWAKANELPQGVREAALLAAELEPGLAGLDPLLRPFGLILDEEAGRWMSFEDSMARRGLVRDDGEWITVAAQRERQAERDRHRAVLAQEEASRRMAAAAEAMERSERRRELERYRDRAYDPTVVVAFPVLAYPVVLPPVIVVPDPPYPVPLPPVPPTAPPRHGYGRYLDRAPGSLLPPPGDPAPRVPGSIAARSAGG